VLIAEFEQPIKIQKNFEVLRAQSMQELSLVAIQPGNPKWRLS